MKIKKNNGLTGIDTVIAIIALMLFSTLIISMIYNNVFENVKLKQETLAMIYITEIFENIGIEDYNNITQENISQLVPKEVIDNNYEVTMDITTDFEDVTNKEDIMKKINVTLTYKVGDKNYSCSMQRMKTKE